MKQVAVITNYNIPEKMSAAFSVAERLIGRVEKILIPINYKDRIFRAHMHKSEYSYLAYDELYKEAELVIVLGGDGFMLESARAAAPYGLPILGVNLGRVGYMTEIESDELQLIDKIFEGEYTIDERAMLKVEVIGESGQKKFSSYALNDAVIANGVAARIIDFELSDGDELISSYRADGLVIATPTGSTAYSLSAGGPIVDPKLSCFCVTPVCPHSLGARPLVFPDSARLSVKNTCVREKVIHLTLDGRVNHELYFGDRVEVTRSELTAKLLRVKKSGFYSKIRQKKIF